MADQKQLEDVEHSTCLVILITNDVRCTHDIYYIQDCHGKSIVQQEEDSFHL